ncbi:Outer membrane receptor for ferrienterochelin and colicins [Tenacibaculum soleae]|uniref:TonB-dependent receptor n=1 Tax=Tenacibaculum soleae TaxID=447689 RepID=UPI003AB2CC66
MLKSKLFHVFILLSVLFTQAVSYSQDSKKKVSFKQVINTLKNKYKVQFNYQSNLLNNIFVFPPNKNLTFNEKIKNLEAQTSFKFSKISDNIISIVRIFKFCGFIKDKIYNTPLEGASIITINSISETDKNGYFQFSSKNKNSVITIKFIGFKTVSIPIKNLIANNCKEILLEEQNEVIDPIIITEYLIPGIDKNNNGSTIINFDNFPSLPGLIESDVLQTIQALPGIQSTDETVSNINIRGGSHDQNLFLWDDIKMYQSGHFFGLISSFNPQITKKAYITSNGTDPSYTDGVSGTIAMETGNKVKKLFSGNIGVNFISADAFFDIPLGKKSSLQLVGRKSISNWIQTPTYKTYFKRVTQLTEVEKNLGNVINSNQNFDFYDSSLRWIYHPSKKDIFKLNFILINNNLTFNETAEINQVLETKQSFLSQNSIAAGISYEKKWNSNFSTLVNIYETDYKLQATNADVLQNQLFSQENTVSETSIKVSGAYNFKHLKFKAGYQFIESKITNLTNVDKPRFLRLNSNVIREHAVFTQLSYKNKKGFSIKPGLRINYNSKFSKFLIEPRLILHHKINHNIQIEALGEFKHQNSTQIINFQNDFLGIEKRRWQLANEKDIPVLKSKQASLGFLFSKRKWLFDTKLFYKKVTGITTKSQGFTTKYEFKKAIGSYSALGIDILLRKRIKNFSNWVSYSFIKNRYKFNTLEDLKFPSNFDNTHTFTLGSTYSNNRLSFSVGYNYKTGKPTSIPKTENQIINNTINFGAANSSRIKDYYRLDASILYKFKISKKFNSEIGAAIWNILDRENIINNYYRIENNTPNKFSRSSLGTTTNFVFKVFF